MRVSLIRKGITFWQDYWNAWRQSLVRQGRASRDQFGGFWFVHTGILSVGFLGTAVIPHHPWSLILWLSLQTGYLLASLVPTVTLTMRRLRDISRSPAWVWLYVLFPLGWFVLIAWASAPSVSPPPDSESSPV
ncbi:Uncharacterized membrane protein YhaH, DUF805 family [Sulfobacillus thermosulfidooxidans DSM 9293]|uniref:Uncharacterized membrane protein YhaH, DUF805 family n=2 Tax=Sulfobacillus thermosulfidooxidans TaxID=28034 RepID=A0A1W1WPC0_SULTA|nr:DUF805 domain-containing protein [Sulfobacillus thermosulfidooxidans]PSR23692.1 MAG: DUF805 domain-containing protein [Sulfobacillus thermosulfidooxidans]SMC08164.1 Uncharacterized membrane protein YhaH, DUF805 family [Sulfobacillus thermosulfidooxidans DSM 9293]